MCLSYFGESKEIQVSWNRVREVGKDKGNKGTEIRGLRADHVETYRLFNDFDFYCGVPLENLSRGVKFRSYFFFSFSIENLNYILHLEISCDIFLMHRLNVLYTCSEMKTTVI